MSKPAGERYTVAVDFDGVLHSYTSPWINAEAVEQAITLLNPLARIKPGNVERICRDEDLSAGEQEIRRVAVALIAARRSAHLEDARAGCYFCASKRADVTPKPTKREGWSGWWHAVDKNFLECTRPEVWDAHSLTGGGR